MTTQCRIIRESFERNTLMKMRKSDNEEKMTKFEYLLKVSENNSNSLNYRGKGPKDRWKPGRGQRGNQRGY